MFVPETANVDQWLVRLEALHPVEIDLGLARVSAVGQRMGCLKPAPLVLVVGGTNGKGTTSALLAALLRAQGLRVGVYNSPHIHRYNERVSIDGQLIDDGSLCASFRAVEAKREGSSLTYFEFGTLAALAYFQAEEVDACVLEVGLGGRLDAVNIVEPSISVVTSIGLDHQAFLGDSVEQIAVEKLGIARADQYLVCGQLQPPANAKPHIETLGARWVGRGEQFDVETSEKGLCVRFIDAQGQSQHWTLPQAHIPHHNVATAIQALALLQRLPSQKIVAACIEALRVAGRLQAFARGALHLTLDVAHNPQAAQYVGQRLGQVDGVILGMLADKDAQGVLDVLPAHDQLWLVGLDGPRGVNADELNQRLAGRGTRTFNNVAEAMDALPESGRWLLCGSFYTVEAALSVIEQEASAWIIC